MLGMIEINLLPQEYRLQERTPLGLFLTIVVGICTVGAIGVYEINLKKDLAAAELAKADFTKQKADWEKKKADTQDLEKKIETAKKRQETIIQISQSKIIWSQKLVQFGKIMAEYPDFWIDRLQLQKTDKGKLTMNIFALFDDRGFNRIADFQSSMINDANFWYHFDRFDSPTQRVTPGGGPLAKYGFLGPVAQFEVSLPVR